MNDKYLILDTSTSVQLVILIVSNKIISIQKNVKPKSFVSCMIPLISRTLKENNINISQLTKIIVGIGPGSYTGTKVAVLTAKILSLELKISLYKISSLLLLTSGYYQSVITPKVNINNSDSYALSLVNGQIILPEDRYTQKFLTQFQYHILLNEEKNLKIALDKLFDYIEEVKDPHYLVPNYCCPVY
ncbi:MAG: tRNA (adenosine(37)-N6)-threonylcarbamoyltransferase complex dimerization subunit type 1 TsaB [Weeping tea tree witches'-broom phytoplasma]|uniref:tRNA (adenosine(37)-N6)-threonylcarbamoyltransferase complex dimerization subunit type 1 TsaB n=1 Tax=Candidatus Phytoplasma melaleucae TaxID=2982630 RepID=UPI00293A8499|nr:tRNA (adenosine(37)-N6)-threonylcarbamoyltransferase complex dimerization subunit type 1 TsaB [Weeping tea tree witches'-broom phytoplasma]